MQTNAHPGPAGAGRDPNPRHTEAPTRERTEPRLMGRQSTPSNDTARQDFSTVGAAARGRWPDILCALGIADHHLKDEHGPCPGCGGRDRFRFDDRDQKGTWYCSGGGEPSSGDGFGLLAHVHGWTPAETLQRVAEHLRLDRLAKVDHGPRPAVRPAARQERTTRRPEPIPAEAMARRPNIFRDLGAAVASWSYHDADGRPLVLVSRFEKPDGSKEFRPQTWTQADGWRWQGHPEPRPLYHLDQLAARPDAPVLICEGERSADAAALLAPEYVTCTSLNGAQSPKRSDWSPLAGRTVRVWPDNDDAGAQYARTVAALAFGAGAQSVEVLDLDSIADALPLKFDAADAVAGGWTSERLSAARWVEIPSPYSFSERTGGTEGTALNDKEFSGSPAEKSGGTEGTAAPKPPVSRPCFEVHERLTGYGPSGLYWHGLKGEDEIDQWVCSPLYADAMTHTERDSDHGLLLRFRNAVGRWRDWCMPMEMLRGSGEELRGELLALGVRIDPAGHRLLNGYLMSRYPKRRVLAATSTGWHADGAVFVLPNQIIGAGDVRFQSEYAQHDEFVRAGTLDGWRAEIAARCAGNPMLAFAVAASLAGPLLAKVHRMGGGFHLVGDSSTGKSTALSVGASVWGGPRFIRTWDATANGLEGIAAALNDTALILDEISQADPQKVGQIIYAVGNGTGKSRATRTGGARAVRRWRVMLLSSGERTLEATMAEGGKRIKAGQEARLLNVPCARRYGIFDDLCGMASGRVLSDALRTAADTHHGHAGPAFIERLVSDPGDVSGLLAAIHARPEFAAETSLEGRAAGAFALVAAAGELATDYGILPWSDGAALMAAATAYRAWKDARGKGHTETRQILDAVNDFIARHGDARFSLLGDAVSTIRDRAGWYRDTGTGEDRSRTYLFTPDGLREAAGGFDFARALDALESAGWIADHDDRKRSKKTKVQGRSLSLYAIIPRDPE